MVGQALASRIFRRSLSLVTFSNLSIRLSPMVVCLSISSQAPFTQASRENSFTRCPRGMYSCTRKRLKVNSFPKSKVRDALTTPSSVAQYVSGSPSATFHGIKFPGITSHLTCFNVCFPGQVRGQVAPGSLPPSSLAAPHPFRGSIPVCPPESSTERRHSFQWSGSRYPPGA